MIIAKLEIPLHDRSLVQVSRTDTGALYLEVYGPGHAKDGHGYILKGSTLLADADISALRALLTSGGGNSVASGRTAGTAGDGHQPAPITSSTRGETRRKQRL